MSRNLENKKKSGSSSAAGGGRSAVTGTKLGKGARRALNKNADCIDNFLCIVNSANTLTNLTDWLDAEALTVGRVTRSTGCGRLEVTVLDIEAAANSSVGRPVAVEGASIPICGTLKFKGRSNTKSDRANCMCVGDVIVVRGGLASAKCSAAAADAVQRVFDRLGVKYPKSFFAATASSAAAEAEEGAEFGFVFDRSEELAAEEKEVAALRAETARASALRTGRVAASSSDDDEVNIDAI